MTVLPSPSKTRGTTKIKFQQQVRKFHLMSLLSRLLALVACLLSWSGTSRAFVIVKPQSYAVVFSATNGNTDNSPVSSQVSNKNIFKGAAAIAATAGLVVGKKVYDGPVFDESVSLRGKTVVITGGNTGLGKETAVKLASLGAETIILCRTPSRAESAIAEIKQRSGNNAVRSSPLDLADLRSIENCANGLKSSIGKIDILVNNAGVMAIPTREVTNDGFEKHMGINHLGHFALTGLLIGLLKKSDAARIINVSSTAHLLGNIDKSDFLLDKEGAYQPWPAYGNSKLANIWFTKALADKLKSACRTELGRYILDPDSIPKALQPVLAIPAAPLIYFTKSAEQGAQTQIYLSASNDLSATRDSGKYYDNSKEATPSDLALDRESAEWLWRESEKLTGIKFNI